MDAIDCTNLTSGPYVVVYPYARGGGGLSVWQTADNGTAIRRGPTRTNRARRKRYRIQRKPCTQESQSAPPRNIDQLAGDKVRLIGKYRSKYSFSFLSGVILAIPNFSISPSVNLNAK